MPVTTLLTHLRRNVVAYLALLVALGTGTAYAAAAIPNGSITAAKLHTNAVTSTKIKNGTVKPKDLKKPTYVQSTNLALGTPPAVPDVISLAAYDFAVPAKGRTSVTVFIPTIGGGAGGGGGRGGPPPPPPLLQSAGPRAPAPRAGPAPRPPRAAAPP